MLTQSQLLALYDSLRDKRVLSVYIDGSATDPASQRSWRVQLGHSLTDLRSWLADSSHGEREEFERAVKLLEDRLTTFEGSIVGPGWAAFITPDRIQDAQHVPAIMPTLAVWSTGPCLAPYMRALKEARPVIVAVVDARRACLHRYQLGRLERVETIRAYHVVDRPEHMGAPPQQGFHSGTSGTTGTDAAQRSLLTGRDRMLAETAERIAELAGERGWILLGGIKRVVARLADRIESAAPNRVSTLPSLDVHATDAEIARAAREGASALRDAFDSRRIDEIANLAGAHGLGVIGPAETTWALGQSSVRELFLTRGYLDDHAAEAEDAVRAALAQDASVEEVSGAAQERLERCGGMAAALRFRGAPIEGEVEAATVV